MKCPKCLTENEEPRRFCRKCGGKLSIICPGCGFENLPDDDFCGGCGCNLKEQEESPSIDFSRPQSYTPKHLADKILEYVQKGLKIQEEMGFPYFMSLIKGFMALIHLGLGELKPAEKCAEKAVKLAQENHEKYSEGISWALLGRVIGKKELKEIERAEKHIIKGIQISEELKAKPSISQGYFYLGELYADAGTKDGAMNHLKKAEKMFQEMGMDYWLNRTKEVLERV